MHAGHGRWAQPGSRAVGCERGAPLRSSDPRRASRFDSPGFHWDKAWRKREGIEPTGDVSASRPDLKSGGATSAPSASVH